MKEGKLSLRAKRKLIGFLIVGTINTFLVIAWMYFLNTIFSGNQQLASLTIANLFGLIQGHYMQRRYIWKSQAGYLIELVKFSIGAIPSLVGSFLFFIVFATLLGVGFIWVQFFYSIFAAMFAFVWNNFKTFPRDDKQT